MDALARALDSCVALIAVIGPSWSTIADERGRRRLDDPDDWVRREIGEALRRGIRVIPVALTSAMPREDELPPDLQPLVRRQAAQVSDRHWRQDVESLAKSLETVPGLARRRDLSPRLALEHGRRVLLVVGALLGVAAGAWFGWSSLHGRPSGPDLSDQVRIRDAGQEGTAVGLAVASAMEASLAHQGRPVTLSGRYLYRRAQRADQFPNDSNGGTALAAALYVAETWGAPPEEKWPYVAGETGLPKGVSWAELDAAAAPFRASTYRLSGYDDIPRQLALGRPVVAEATATQSWMLSPTTETGVITHSAKDREVGGTAIVIVAFDTADRSIKFANSWGVDWGANGFGTMTAKVASHVLGDMWSIEVPPARDA
jgi:hypothetical protein